MSVALITAITASIVAIAGVVFTRLAQWRHANNPSAHDSGTPPTP